MKIHLEHKGAVFEYEWPPMTEHRFKALCLLGAAGAYAGMVAKVAAQCGVVGVAVIAVATLFSIAFANA